MPGTRSVRDCGRRLRKEASGRLSCFHRAITSSRPCFQDVISAISSQAEQQRHVAAIRHLQQVRGEEHGVDDEEEAEHADAPAARPSRTAGGRRRCRQDAGADERARDGDAVGRGQGVAAAEGEDQDQHADEQGGVDLRHVDLPLLRGARMGDRHAGQEVHLHALPRNGIGAGDQSLAGDHGGGGGEHDQRQAELGRCHQEERIGNGRGSVAGSVRLGRNSSAPGRAAHRTPSRPSGSGARRNAPYRHTAPPPP